MDPHRLYRKQKISINTGSVRSVSFNDKPAVINMALERLNSSLHRHKETLPGLLNKWKCATSKSEKG